MADNSIKLFGFEIKRTKKEEPLQSASVVPPTDEDGAGYITAPAHHYGTYVDIDGGTNSTKDNAKLIMQYRSAASHQEVDQAIEEIVNESISTDGEKSPVKLNMTESSLSSGIKKKIEEEFKGICGMLNFTELGHDIFRSWYVDGRLYHHLIVEEGKEKQGIKEIRYIDATKIRKVKHIKNKKDPKTGVELVDKVEEFYIFQNNPVKSKANFGIGANTGVKLSPDSISYVTSGQLDETKKIVVSHLHKVLKPINQLRMMEDSLVIYRLSRAPERRIFYIDVGSLPKGKAEEYMQSIMSKYRNKLVYDANTGQLKDDRKHMSMLEDFWLPRKEGGRGTEISTLPGGQNLGEIDDIIYFQKKVYRALNVPANRIEQESQYSLGRATEISREEVKFQKFVDRLRNRFSKLFLNILKKQLILKGVITESDWEELKNDIFVDYERDNYFYELKQSEILRDRMTNMDQASQYVGEYFSKEWVMKNVFHFTDEEIEEINKQIDKEKEDGDIPEVSPFAQNTPMGQAEIGQDMAAHQQDIDQDNAEHAADLEQEKMKQRPAANEQSDLEKANIELMETVSKFLKES